MSIVIKLLRLVSIIIVLYSVIPYCFDEMKTLEIEDDFSDTTKWCKWIPTSRKLLSEAEKGILDRVRSPYVGKYVTIPHAYKSCGITGGKKEKDVQIWTLAFNETSDKTPLVLLHGFGSGVALWSLNFDAFAKTRPVYAIDFLGFGKSSRPRFSSDVQEAEKEIIASVEAWRKEMKLESFILVGHSMGGFLSMSYALTHPERVKHLILADPWGFPEKPENYRERYSNVPFYVKAIAYVMEPLNPLWGVRFAGPAGPRLIEKFRSDLVNKFSSLAEGADDDFHTKVAAYIYHCNAQSPTGESAFHSMMSSFGWAKFPMANRITDLHKDVPITMIYGASSWVDSIPEDTLKAMRPGSFVNVEIMQNTGHHVYADDTERFHYIVLKACDSVKE